MNAYYNEHDRKTAAWLRELAARGHIAGGVVDERGIESVQAADIAGHGRVHLFAGIGGWDLALQIAGWPAELPVWTGSCPCQPFSVAGKRQCTKDTRDLWPEMRRLVAECRPDIVFGEQVASAEVVGSQLEVDFAAAVQSGEFAKANKFAKRLAHSKSFHFDRRWLDRVSTDLEAEGYTVGAVVLGAHSVGAPHKRSRLYWVAYARSEQGSERRKTALQRRRAKDAEQAGLGGCDSDSVEHAASNGRIERRPESSGRCAVGGCGTGEAVGDAESTRPQGTSEEGETQKGRKAAAGRTGLSGGVDGGAGGMDRMPGAVRGNVVQDPRDAHTRVRLPADRGNGLGSILSHWSDYRLVACDDARGGIVYRRASIEPASFPLAAGLPGRVGLLRGSGNAIVPQVAAVFIRAVMIELGIGGES